MISLLSHAINQHKIAFRLQIKEQYLNGSFTNDIFRKLLSNCLLDIQKYRMEMTAQKKKNKDF